MPQVEHVRVVFVLRQAGGLHHNVQNHLPLGVVPFPPDFACRKALPLDAAAFDRDRPQDSAVVLGTVVLEAFLAQTAARFDVISDYRPLAGHHFEVL
ncbi:hypothetical protein D3C76_1270700 [compost metagenome]